MMIGDDRCVKSEAKDVAMGVPGPGWKPNNSCLYGLAGFVVGYCYCYHYCCTLHTAHTFFLLPPSQRTTDPSHPPVAKVSVIRG